MSLREWGKYALLALAVLLSASIVLGSVLGQPVLLGYVETGSMSPTLEPGDGFVAVPTKLDGSIEEGDVVVFEAKAIQGGGLTTHRIVGETDRGFVTRGDANSFTDQDNDEPPVKRAQIKATALSVGGEVVKIPHLGTIVEGLQSILVTIQGQLAGVLGVRSLLGVQGLAYLFFAVTLVWFAVAEWRDRQTKSRERDSSRNTGVSGHLVVGALTMLLVLSATAAMVVPAGGQEYGIVSSEFESDRPNVVPVGESNDLRRPVGNAGFVPVIVYLEPASEGVDVAPNRLYVHGQSSINATVTLHAPPETGYYRRYVVEHRYLALLPRSHIDALYSAHPWLPIVGIDALLALPFYLLGIRLLGTGRIRSRSRDTPSRLRRLWHRYL